jgi:hypothetical protein
MSWNGIDTMEIESVANDKIIFSMVYNAMKLIMRYVRLKMLGLEI